MDLVYVGAQHVYQTIGTDLTLRRMEVYPGMKHELFQETFEEKALKPIALVVDYLDAHVRQLAN